MARAVRYQGQLTTESCERTTAFRALTRWPQFVTMALTMRLGIRYFQSAIPDFPQKHPKTAVTIEVPEAVTDRNEQAFRDHFLITKEAQFFKRSMHIGAALIHGLRHGGLPDGVSKEQLLLDIHQILSPGAKLAEGFQRLFQCVMPNETILAADWVKNHQNEMRPLAANDGLGIDAAAASTIVDST